MHFYTKVTVSLLLSIIFCLYRKLILLRYVNTVEKMNQTPKS